MAVVTSRGEWPVVRSGGPDLVRVEIRPGVCRKMFRADAIAQGLLPAEDRTPERKQREAPEDKMRRPAEDKGQPKQPEDFTTIPGVGAATAKAIAAEGILTFEALQAADLSFLGARAAKAIEIWRAA